jgi:hypothetical protein
MWVCKRERVIFFYIFIIKLKMASYTANQLYGSGTYAEALNGTKTFQFTNPSNGSAYFILEAVRNELGFYDSTSNTVASASYSLGSGISGLVTSSYIAGVAIEPGVHSMSITFENNTPISGSILRTTGEISLIIS